MGFRFIAFITILFSFLPLGANGIMEEWKSFSKTDSANDLIRYLQCNAKSELDKVICDMVIPATPSFYGRMGIFVTIVKNGKIRGCYGAFNHKTTNFSKVIKEYLHGALKDDPRYPPLELEELKSANFIITLAESPIPVSDTDSIHLSRYGIYLVKESGEGIVYVPGEIKSHSRLNGIIKKEKIQDVNIFKAILIR